MNEKMFAPQAQEDPKNVDAFAETLSPPPASLEPTLRQSQPQFTENKTLRSAEEFDDTPESGTREKAPDGFTAQGMAPRSEQVTAEEVYEMTEEAGAPSNFKTSAVPSYEISAMGTVPSPENAGAPNEPSEILQSWDSEINEKPDNLAEFMRDEQQTLKSADEGTSDQRAA